jgi:hypothetical protein
MRRSSAFAALIRAVLRRSNFALAFLLAVLVTVPLLGAEIVLVPIWYQGAGAQGSQWLTHLSVYNNGGYIEPADGGVLPCQWLISPCPRGFWKSMMLVYEAPISMAGGFVMTVPNNDTLSYSLRVFESTAQLEDLGIDLPVVRERDLKTAPVQLMDIPPSDPDLFRYMLRIYAIGGAPTAVVRVNGYLTMGDGQPDLIVTKEITLQRVRHGLGHYYAEENDVVRQLIQATGGMGQLRIEIEPMSPNLRWWGMVSATNNRTQDVTIVTPN